MTAVSVPEQLAGEFRRLGIGDDAQPVATFTAKPMEAYTLAAALQACSRHPGLSDTQRELVLGFAHQVAGQLTNMARAILGPESAVETTLVMGFDPQFDVPRGGFEVIPGGLDDDEAPDLDELEDLGVPDEVEEDSHILGQRRCRYVEPKWIVLREDEAEMELCKCAKCNRFFVQSVPIRLFMGEGDDVLGLEVCETCAPRVLTRMQVH
jgi:hypothetical protein